MHLIIIATTLLTIFLTTSAHRVTKYNQQPNNNGTTNTTCTTPTSCPLQSLDQKQISIQMIRTDILRRLKLDENNLPNVTLKEFPIPPIYLNEIANIQNDGPIDDEEEEVAEKVIAFSRMQNVRMNGKETRGAHYFKFSEKLSTSKIDSAFLHVHVRNLQGGRKWPEYRIQLFEIILHTKGESIVSIGHGPFKPYISAPPGPELRHVRSRWVLVDIKTVLTKWLEKNGIERKIGFVIEAVDLTGGPVDVGILNGNGEVDVDANPFVELKLLPTSRPRPPRSMGMDCDEDSTETRCCRFPLVVDFEEFGWDWIIAPKKYDANYCSGECPFAFLQKYPHNHIVQQAGIGGPCCAARRMSPITMLYFDKESNIVFSVLNGMVVDKCGCS